MGDSRRSWCAFTATPPLPPPRHAACNPRRLPPPPPVHTPTCRGATQFSTSTPTLLSQVLSRLGPIVLLFAALFRALTGAAPPAPFPLLSAPSAWSAAVCLLLPTAVFAAADVALDADAWRRSIMVQSAALVAPQLSDLAARGARLWVWAALRTHSTDRQTDRETHGLSRGRP